MYIYIYIYGPADPTLALCRSQVFAVSEQGPAPIPDMRRDKEGWYRYWDEDGNGSLDQEEVARALLKTLRLTSNQLRVTQMRETLRAIWPIFDTDGSGAIDREEFLRCAGPEAGCILYIHIPLYRCI